MKRMTRENFEHYQTVITKVMPDIIHVHGTELNFAQIKITPPYLLLHQFKVYYKHTDYLVATIYKIV